MRRPPVVKAAIGGLAVAILALISVAIVLSVIPSQEPSRFPAETYLTNGPTIITISDGWGIYLPETTVACTLSDTTSPGEPTYDCPNPRADIDINGIKEGRVPLPPGAHYVSAGECNRQGSASLCTVGDPMPTP